MAKRKDDDNFRTLETRRYATDDNSIYEELRRVAPDTYLDRRNIGLAYVKLNRDTNQISHRYFDQDNRGRRTGLIDGSNSDVLKEGANRIRGARPTRMCFEEDDMRAQMIAGAATLEERRSQQGGGPGGGGFATAAALDLVRFARQDQGHNPGQDKQIAMHSNPQLAGSKRWPGDPDATLGANALHSPRSRKYAADAIRAADDRPSSSSSSSSRDHRRTREDEGFSDRWRP
jgi:hypothetical protein